MRYEADVEVRLRHVLAVEAETPFEAQEKVMAQMLDRSPDELKTRIHIQVGVSGKE
jgi:hypothetical protein